MKRIKTSFGKMLPIINGIGSRRLETYAAAGTFYFFLSLPPIIILLCSILPFTSVTKVGMLSVVQEVVPESMYALVESVVENVYGGTATTLSISVIFILWSASLTMASLMRGLSVAYDVKRRENYFVFRLKAIFYMIILLIAAVLSLIAIVFGKGLIDIVRSLVSIDSPWRPVLHKLSYLRYGMMLVFLMVVFVIFYRFTSGTKEKIWNHFWGAAFSAVGWILFSAVFSIYMSITNMFSIYGILGTIIAALLWMYYCIYIMLIGGYLNHVIYTRKFQN